MADSNPTNGLWGIAGLTRTKAWIISGLLTSLIGVMIPDSNSDVPSVEQTSLKSPEQIAQLSPSSSSQQNITGTPVLPSEDQLPEQANTLWTVPLALENSPFEWVNEQVSESLETLVPEPLRETALLQQEEQEISPDAHLEQITQQLTKVQRAMTISALYHSGNQWSAIVDDRLIQPGQMWNENVRIAEISATGLTLEWVESSL